MGNHEPVACIDAEVAKQGLLPCVVESEPLRLFRNAELARQLVSAIRASVEIDPHPDLHTGVARKRVAAEAHKVRRAKSYLDAAGKELVTDAKRQIKQVDENRKLLRDGCDAIVAEVRAPLEAWEAAERARQEAEALASEYERCHEIALAENETFDLRREAARQEAARRQQEEAARRQQEDEERARRLAAQQIREAAEARERAEHATIEATARAAERAKSEAERAERNRLEAAESAEREKQAAVEAERKRAADAQAARDAQDRAIRAEAERKAADESHRAQVRAEAIQGLVVTGLEMDLAEVVVLVIDAGVIPHVTIQY